MDIKSIFKKMNKNNLLFKKSFLIIYNKVTKDFYLKPFTILIDTTLKNINLTTPIPPNIHFYRNHHFEHLAPITASELWANNILNLLNIILPTPNTLDLTATYIKPMIKENT